MIYLGLNRRYEHSDRKEFSALPSTIKLQKVLHCIFVGLIHESSSEIFHINTVFHHFIDVFLIKVTLFELAELLTSLNFVGLFLRWAIL